MVSTGVPVQHFYFSVRFETYKKVKQKYERKVYKASIAVFSIVERIYSSVPKIYLPSAMTVSMCLSMTGMMMLIIDTFRICFSFVHHDMAAVERMVLMWVVGHHRRVAMMMVLIMRERLRVPMRWSMMIWVHIEVAGWRIMLFVSVIP